MIHLNNILPKEGILDKLGPDNPIISSITSDSRTAEKNSLFFAVRGVNTDGHNFISKAIENGASAVVCENLPDVTPGNVCFVVVNDSSLAIGEIASAFYDFPSAKLKLIGVTGTNGKTTTVSILYRLFKDMGHKVGLISTVKYIIHNQEIEATHTTPDSISLNRILAQMVQTGCEYCFMEVSSHAVDQERIAGLDYKGGVFTNLTHDHLDYHKTFNDYLAAKKKFFDKLDENAFALVNIDDKHGRVMVQNTKANVRTFSMVAMADFKVKIIESHFDGMLLQINNKEVWSRLIGEFNAYNLIAVFGSAVLLGKNPTDILPLLSTYQSVEGRFEYIQSADGALAIIDYAHTPDALLNVLNTIQQLRQAGGQVITLVGAGGNRDKTKRPVMAKVAVINSDKVILTSDNPRNEDPEEILSDMMKGVAENEKWRVVVITNRKEAIKSACMMLSSGDILLVAGKGHETYQEVKGVKSHFSDKEEVQNAFKIRNKI